MICNDKFMLGKRLPVVHGKIYNFMNLKQIRHLSIKYGECSDVTDKEYLLYVKKFVLK